jgi:hypothetical protein
MAQPPLSLVWWYEHLLCQENIEPEVIQYLGDHLLEEISARTAARNPRMPAPVATRLYLRMMRPAAAAVDELVTAESQHLLPTLGYLLAMHAPFGGEFHAGVDAPRVRPPMRLLAAAAGSRLAARVAAAVAEDRRAPDGGEVRAELDTVLRAANLEALAEEPALQARCGAGPPFRASRERGRAGGWAGGQAGHGERRRQQRWAAAARGGPRIRGARAGGPRLAAARAPHEAAPRQRARRRGAAHCARPLQSCRWRVAWPSAPQRGDPQPVRRCCAPSPPQGQGRDQRAVRRSLLQPQQRALRGSGRGARRQAARSGGPRGAATAAG